MENKSKLSECYKCEKVLECNLVTVKKLDNSKKCLYFVERVKKK